MQLNITAALGSALVAVVLLAGCGGSSTVGRSYDDFTAYFNTFYNAKQAFEEGQQAIEAEAGEVDRSVYLPLFPTSNHRRNRQQFQEVVSKSADVLREHPNSRWVDDALLLIGKSYFYLNNYVGAEQKFREAIGLGTDQADEARFWLARTLIASGSHDKAVQHLQESLLRDDLTPTWESRLQLALGIVHQKEGNWEEAVQSIQEGIQGIRDSNLEARAYFLLGQIYETMGRYEEAIAAFEEVQNRRPGYELSYAAQVSGIRINGLYGDAETALDDLDRMQRDDKHFEHSAEMAFLRGRIYQSRGRSREAASLYKSLLNDSGGSNRDVAPRVHHALGELYRDAYNDYVTAAAHFDTAATELQQIGSRDVSDRRSAPEALVGVQERADMFGTFAEVRSNISRMDSLLHLGGLDEPAFNEVVLQMRRAKARELAARRQQRDAAEIQQSFSEERAEGQEHQDAAQSAGEAGFLFHRDPVRVQEGREGFVMRWGDRPLAENWRRSAALSSVAAEETDESGIDDSQAEGLEAVEGFEQLPAVDVSEVPRDSISRAQMQIDRAHARYELGNVLFLLMNEPDSAAVWYRRVIEEDAEQAVAARAYYALAEVRRSQGDMAAARRFYEEVLLQDADAELASRARARLGQQADAPAPADSLAQARSAYRRAYEAWRQRQYERALSDMLVVARQYDSTPVAPKALLAAGSIYLEWVRQDGLDLSVGIPFSLDDSSTTVTSVADTLPVVDEMPRPAPDTAVVDSLDQAQALLADASAGVRRMPLSRLYTVITEQYPDSPQAGRAEHMLAALEERGLLDGVEDSTDMQAQAAEQSTAGSEADTVRQQHQAAPPAPEENEPFGLRGREIDRERGGYTWVVASHPEPGRAHRMVAQYQRSGYRAKVIARIVDGQRRHEVIVGQFPSREEAVAKQVELPPGSSADPEVISIPKN